MVDLTAIQAAVTGLQTARDIAKTAIGLRDAALVQEKVSELTGIILSAQSNALDAQAEQSVMLDTIRSLKEQLAEMEKWGADKERYELKEIAPGQFAYSVTEAARGSEPPHKLCANCYNHNQKSSLQTEMRSPGHHEVTFCPNCGSDLFSPDSGGRGPEHPVVKSGGGSWARARRGR